MFSLFFGKHLAKADFCPVQSECGPFPKETFQNPRRFLNREVLIEHQVQHLSLSTRQSQPGPCAERGHSLIRSLILPGRAAGHGSGAGG